MGKYCNAVFQKYGILHSGNLLRQYLKEEGSAFS